MSLTLLLRLEGPLQSWGTRARWDYRDSGDEPTKSGIVGLLGCALGYPVGDMRLEELDAALQVAVRTEHVGIPMVDFHTITGVLPTADGKFKGKHDPATIISPRVYLQDAGFLVAIAGLEELLQKCHSALLRPRWPIYLGRKACIPSRPVVDVLTRDYAHLVEAVTRHPWDFTGVVNPQDTPTRLKCVVESLQGETERNDCLRVNPARMYATRRVSVFYVDFPGSAKEVEHVSVTLNA